MEPIKLILLPGLDGTGLLFQPLVDALPSTITPVVISYPGDRFLSYDELLPIVLEQLPRDEPYVLVAESFSGPLGVMITATRPDNLIGLVLCATFVTAPWRFIGPIVRLIARAPIFRFFLTFKQLRALLSGRLTDELRQSLARMNDLVRPHVVAARVRMVFRVDVREALRKVEVTILYLRGTRDRLVPKRNLDLILQLRPDVRVQTFNSTHLILQREPKACTEAIRVHLRSSVVSTAF